MTLGLGLVVEGHGEVDAVPILVRRIAARLGVTCNVPRPLRTPRSTLVKPGEIERAIALMGAKVAPHGGVLVLIDADDDLACELGPTLLARARKARADLPVAVVLAVREYEAWFLAAARSLRGVRGLPADLDAPADPERIRDAKRWLDSRMARYRETVDQPALTAAFDIESARAAPSFDKLVRDLTGLLGVAPTEGEPAPTAA